MAQVIDSDVVFDGKVGHNSYHTNIADMEGLICQMLGQIAGTASSANGTNIAAIQAFVAGVRTTPSGLTPSGDTSGATDTSAIQALLTSGVPVKLGSGTFYVNSALTMATQGQAIFGEFTSVPKPAQKNMPTIIKLANGSNTSIFSVTVGGCYIGYLQLDGNNSNQSSGSNAVISLAGANGACTVDRCQVLNGFADGIQMTNAGAHKVVNSWVGLCNGHGINVGTTSDNTIIGTLVGSNALDNVYTAGFVTHIIDCDIFSSTGGAGIHCDATGSAFIITNCGIDRNSNEGILVSAGGAQISNCTIHSNSQAGNGSFNSINFTSGTTQSVTGCHFWLDGGITNKPNYHIGFSGGGAAKTSNNAFAAGSYVTGTISKASELPDPLESSAATTNTSGSAPILTSVAGTNGGGGVQLSDTTRDYIVYLQVGTAGTAYIVSMGHTSSANDVTLHASGAAVSGDVLSFRLPAGWYFLWSATTATLAQSVAVGC